MPRAGSQGRLPYANITTHSSLVFDHKCRIITIESAGYSNLQNFEGGRNLFFGKNTSRSQQVMNGGSIAGFDFTGKHSLVLTLKIGKSQRAKRKIRIAFDLITSNWNRKLAGSTSPRRHAASVAG